MEFKTDKSRTIMTLISVFFASSFFIWVVYDHSVLREALDRVKSPDSHYRSRRSINDRPNRQRARRDDSQKAFAHFHANSAVAANRYFEAGPMVASNGTDLTYRFWQYAPWINQTLADKFFHLDIETGHLHVKKEGIYFVYAQIVFHDLANRWMFAVYVQDRERVKCISTEQLHRGPSNVYDPSSHGVYQQCYTGQMMKLFPFQSISIRDLYGARTIMTKPEFTFWGIFSME